MGSAKGIVEASFEEQEIKPFASFRAYPNTSSSFMATIESNNSTAQMVLDQQKSTSQIHPSHHQQQLQQDQLDVNQISFGTMQSSSSSSLVIPNNFISKMSKESGGAYDLGDLDQALFLYLQSQDSSAIPEQRQNSGMRPPTLNIFPSQPMHVVDPSSSSSSAKASMALVSSSPSSSGSKRSFEPSMELSNPTNDVASAAEPSKAFKSVEFRKVPNLCPEKEVPKQPDSKTLRRLAQNREAARKSRLRKKAYVQQLESSRIKLTQLEHEIQRARAQGIHIGGNAALLGDQSMPSPMGNIISDATAFDIEYARWLDEHHRLMCELQNGVQEQLPDNELRLFVDGCMAHYDELLNLKSIIVKSDVFHLVSGMWKTPAERCFMWMGGFQPSDLLKILMSQIEPLSEQQLLSLCTLQQSIQEAEDALSQGLAALNQSLSDTIASDALSCPTDMANYMGQMALAINKLSALESFVRQADNLRHQTVHRLQHILTTRQAARCILALAEYFQRLRTLSSFWLARPRQD